jgi:DNA-binding NarL/FixJ family response regulator
MRRPTTSTGPTSTPQAPGVPIRLVVADDQPIDLAGIRGLLETQPDLLVVGVAESGEEAVARCAGIKPDVLILDVNMPGLASQGTLEKMREVAPSTRVIAVAERGDRRCTILNPPGRPALAALEASPCASATDCLEFAVAHGAHGAIRRSAKPEELFRAVRAVAAGNAWYEPLTAARMLEKATGIVRGSGESTLTSREVEVSGLISDGRSNKEIARALKICEATVKKHVRGALTKLGLKDRLQIGLYFARNPILLSRPPVRRPKRLPRR